MSVFFGDLEVLAEESVRVETRDALHDVLEYRGLFGRLFVCLGLGLCCSFGWFGEFLDGWHKPL